jgi:CubicO group peptidase (beta-lactamase class C family)
MRLPLLAVLIASCSVAVLAQAAAPKTASATLDLKPRLDCKVPLWLKAYEVPSAAVAFIEHGKLAWTAVYGEQSPGVPATDKTLYNVASLTKPISAEVVLRLASEGKLSLDEPVYPYWTDWDVKDNPWNRLLTARLCLSHQTGFPNWRGQNPDKVLNFRWQPGTNTGYSGEGYQYMARYVENRVGRSFEDLAQQYVFDPIGMHDTSFTPRD